MARCQWKRNIIHQLKARNRLESHAFLSLVEAHNKLFEQVSLLKSKNVHLTVETEKLKEENLTLQIRGESGTGTGGTERNQALEQKLYKQQQELTELHRKRGENAQKIIDLTDTLKTKEKELQMKEASLTVYTANEASNQLLQKEHEALLQAFTELQERYRQVRVDNEELLARWIELKLQEADGVNAEHEIFKRNKQQQLQEKLADAAKVPIDIIQPDLIRRVLPICLSASIPTRAQTMIDAHDGEVNAVLWSPTGAMFATGGSDRKIKLWEYSGGQCLCKWTLVGSNGGITSLEFDDSDGLLLGASNDNASRLWSLADQRLRHTLTGHGDKVLAAKFLGDNTKVVSGSHDRTLKIWDLNIQACIKTIFAGSKCNDVVTLHGRNITSGHFDKRIRFWDTRTENMTNEIDLQGGITSLALHPDKMSMLACSRDDTLKLIDLRMNQVSQTLWADNFKVAYDWSRAIFSPDGCYAAAGSNDGTLFIWNVQKGKVERMLKEHIHAIIACSWHPVGSHILSCEKQKKVVLWSDM